MLAPVIVNVADPLTHLTEGSKAFIPQSRRVNDDNPGVIPSKTSGGKIHHVLLRQNLASCGCLWNHIWEGQSGIQQIWPDG